MALFLYLALADVLPPSTATSAAESNTEVQEVQDLSLQCLPRDRNSGGQEQRMEVSETVDNIPGSAAAAAAVAATATAAATAAARKKNLN